MAKSSRYQVVAEPGREILEVVGQIQELVGIYRRIQDWWGTCEGFKDTAAIPKQKNYLKPAMHT
jgi:hypothetical protein